MKLVNPLKEHVSLDKILTVLSKTTTTNRWRFEGPVISTRAEIRNLTRVQINDLCMSILLEYPGARIRHTTYSKEKLVRYLLTRQNEELIMTIDQMP